MKPILAARYRPILAAFAHDRTLVAFDFDGTLAPITDRPEAARMRRRTATLLSDVARRYPCVIVTGRSRRDAIGRLQGIPVDIIGNHGAEPARRGSDARQVIAHARRVLAPVAARWPGTQLEDKAYSLSWHYRGAPDGERARAAMLAAAQSLTAIRVVPGKFVLNVVARHAPHKGAAVEAARRQHDCRRAIFVGDDETDEMVFRAGPRSRLLGIRVGPATETSAGFGLRRQEDIDALLEALLRFRSPAPAARRATERPGATALGPTLEFMRLLWALDHALHKRSKRMARRQGITGPQRLALRVIGQMPHMSAGLLADILKLHPSTLTGVLERLRRGRLLTREVDSSDRRRVHLALTPHGRHVSRVSRESVEYAIGEVLGRATALHVESAAELLRALVRELEADPA